MNVSRPSPTLEASRLRVGSGSFRAFKITFITMKFNSVFHWPFPLRKAMSGAKAGPREPRPLYLGQDLTRVNPGSLGASGAPCCMVFTEQRAGGDDSFERAMLVRL